MALDFGAITALCIDYNVNKSLCFFLDFALENYMLLIGKHF